MVLVLRAVDGRHLALAERIIQRVIDLAGVDAQSAGGGAIDHQIGFQALLLLVRVDIAQYRIVFQCGTVSAPIRYRSGCCRPAMCTGRRRCSVGRRRGYPGRLQKKSSARDAGEFTAKPGHDGVNVGAFASGFSDT